MIIRARIARLLICFGLLQPAIDRAQANEAVPCDSLNSFRITYELHKNIDACGNNCEQARQHSAQTIGCSLGGSGQIHIPTSGIGGQEETFNRAHGADTIGAAATAEAKAGADRAGRELRKIETIAHDIVGHIFSSIGIKPPVAPGSAGPSNKVPPASVGSGGGGGFSGAPSSGISGLPPMPTKEQIPDAVALAKAQADWRLAKKARQASADGKIFPRSEAETANDPEIRKQLINLSLTQAARADLKVESTRLTSQLGELASLALEAKQRSEGINSIPDNQGKKTTGKKLAPIENSAIDPKETTEEKTGSLAVGIANVNAPPIEAKEKQSAKNAAEATEPDPEKNMSPEEVSRFRHARLRDLLRTRLDGDDKNFKGVLADSFEGRLARETAGKSSESNPQSENNILTEAFTAAKNAAFAMSTAETEAEVNRLMRESQRELASLAAGGVLEMDSSPLFARVSLAHRRCEEHRCVR